MNTILILDRSDIIKRFNETPIEELTYLDFVDDIYHQRYRCADFIIFNDKNVGMTKLIKTRLDIPKNYIDITRVFNEAIIPYLVKFEIPLMFRS